MPFGQCDLKVVNPRPSLISIVVPVLDEAALIGSFLTHLRASAPGAEVIVVDGGSQDATVSIARSLNDVVIQAPRGRASQMNAGAAIATRAILWFLHVDSILPNNAMGDIMGLLNDPGVVGGCFRLRLPERKWIYRVSDSLGNLGVEIFGFALGDHGIFCRRSAFEKAGGYPDLPIMEDAEIYRKLRKHGRMRQLRAEIISSPRTYQRGGPYRTTALYFCILSLYVLGMPIGKVEGLKAEVDRIKRRRPPERDCLRHLPPEAHLGTFPSFPNAILAWCLL